MLTLIFEGSPRPSGDTAALLAAFEAGLEGEARRVVAYGGGIAPCVDCRWCWNNPGCAIQDGMQPVYAAIQAADNIVIATPLYFSLPTGPLLSVFSRLQAAYAARRFRGETPVPKAKNGVLILAGGGDGSPTPAVNAARSFFRLMNTTPVAQVQSLKTDDLPAARDTAALEQARQAALLLNRLHGAGPNGL